MKASTHGIENKKKDRSRGVFTDEQEIIRRSKRGICNMTPNQASFRLWPPLCLSPLEMSFVEFYELIYMNTAQIEEEGL